MHVNQITTVAKLVPLLLFVVLVALAFKLDVFRAPTWWAAPIRSWAACWTRCAG